MKKNSAAANTKIAPSIFAAPKVRNNQPSLKRRLVLTLFLLTAIRLGNFITIPYVDTSGFRNLANQDGSTSQSAVELLNFFTGNGKESFGVLSLGILPYINASILIQLLSTFIPNLKRLQKTEGEYGRRKIGDYTRFLAFLLAIFQSISVTKNLKTVVFNWTMGTRFEISVILICGSMIVLWFSELITNYGLGNGSSLIICFNIVSAIPDTVKTLIQSFKINPIICLLLVLIFYINTMLCIYLNEAFINLNLLSARQLREPNGNWKSEPTLPLRINQSGVMPIIFTSSFVIFVSTFLNPMITSVRNSNLLQFLPFQVTGTMLALPSKLIFWFIYANLIYFFTQFYSQIVLNPKDISEQLRKNSVIIENIDPGPPTKLFLNYKLRNIATLNAMFLFGMVIMSQLFDSLLSINRLNTKGFGFTSQIILVGSMIDTMRRYHAFKLDEQNQLSEKLDEQNQVPKKLDE